MRARQPFVMTFWLAQCDAAELSKQFEALNSSQRTVLSRRTGGGLTAKLTTQQGVGDELEAQLTLQKGRPAALFALARAINARIPMRLDFSSRQEREGLLAGGKWGQPHGKIAPDIDRGMSVMEAFSPIALACLRQFSLNAPAFNPQHEVEAAHQTRVAIRRLRSALALCAPVLRDDTFGRLRDDLKWLFARLGEARDLDVLAERLASPQSNAHLLTQGSPKKSVSRDDVEMRRQAAHVQLRAVLKSARLDRLLLDLAEWIECGAWRRARHPGQMRDRGLSIGDFSAKRLGKRRKGFMRLAKRFHSLDPAGLHELRIEAKKLRYISEFLEPLARPSKARKRFDRGVETLAALQETLGDIHDLDEMAQSLGQSAGASQIEDWQAKLATERAALLARAAKEAEAAASAKPFWKLI